MEYQRNFKQKVLPHYLKMITSVVSLADKVIAASGQFLSGTKDAGKPEVEIAFKQIQKAVKEAQEIKEELDSKTEESSLKELQDEVKTWRENLQEVEKDLLLLETEQQKKKDHIQQLQTEQLHKEDILNTTAARKAEKETLRNVGYGMIILPFIGIPMVLGASKEIKRCEDLIEHTEESKGDLKVKYDQEKKDLEDCNKKIIELKTKRLEGESLQEKEKELLSLKEEWDMLFDAKRNMSNNLSYMTNLEQLLQMLLRHYDIGNMCKLFSRIEEKGFEDWLHDFNIDRKLSELNEKLPQFYSIYNQKGN
ncbi:uncharacterized protein LOC144504766 [Mustelus asterias]